MSGHHRTNTTYTHSKILHVRSTQDKHYLYHTFQNLTCHVTTGQTNTIYITHSKILCVRSPQDKHYLYHTFQNLICQVTTGQTNTTYITHSKILHVRSPQDKQTLLTSYIQKSCMSGHHRTNKRYLHHTFKNLMCQVKENKVIRSPVKHWFTARQPSVNGCSLILSHLVEGSCHLKEGKCLPH